MKTKQIVAVDIRGVDSLRFRWTCPYTKARTNFSPGLKNSIATDRLKAEALRSQIEMDILTGHYDPSLVKYGKKPSPEDKGNDLHIKDPAIGLFWATYKKDKASTASPRSQKTEWAQVDRFLTQFKLYEVPCSQVKSKLGDYRKAFADSTLRHIFVLLKASFQYCQGLGHIDPKDTNPFMWLTSQLKPAKSERKNEAFTQSEIEGILRHFEGGHYESFVTFLLYTGCRPEDAIALEWSDISPKGISFNKAYSKGTITNGKKGESRLFPWSGRLAQLFGELMNHDVDSPTQRKGLVFPAPKGGYINLNNFTGVTWKKGKFRLPTYHLRHTFITHQLTQGKTPATIAKWVGNSPEMIYRHYAASDSNSTPD